MESSSARYRWLHVAKVGFLATALVAALVGKWQLAGEGRPWDWLFNVLIGSLVVAQVLEIAYRRLRRRDAIGDDEVYAPEPGGGPPGWIWDPARSTWRQPDPPEA